MDECDETKAGAIIGGIAGGIVGPLIGVDPIISGGSLAMTGAIAAAAMHSTNLESPADPANDLFAEGSPDEPMTGPQPGPEISDGRDRFRAMITTRRAARQRVR